MQITIGFGEALTIILAVGGAIGTAIIFIIRMEGKFRTFEQVIGVKLEALTAMRRDIKSLVDRVHQIDLDHATHDPHRGKRMHQLSRARDEHEDDE